MYATIEQEIIEKFDGLAPEAQERVRAAIGEMSQAKFDYKGWRKEQQKIAARIKALRGVTNLTYMDLLSDTRGEIL